jgi:hypothetical protein
MGDGAPSDGGFASGGGITLSEMVECDMSSSANESD